MQEENKTNNIENVKSSVVLGIKNLLPKPCSGQKLLEKIKRMGFTISDLAFLLNRSVGGLYNMTSQKHARYKKGAKNEDLTLDLAIAYLEKMYEEKKERAKQEKQKEKERVLSTLCGQEIISTTLSLKECNTLENKTKILGAIEKLAKDKEIDGKISYKQVADITGLTTQQIAKIREKDSDVDDWFNYTNEAEFDELQNKLNEIIDDTKDTKPSVAIKAIDTKMKYIKSNQKDKTENNDNEKVNIWDKFREMRTVNPIQEINEEVIIDAEIEKTNN